MPSLISNQIRPHMKHLKAHYSWTVLSNLILRANLTLRAWPSNETITEDTGVQKNSVSSALELLRQLHAIVEVPYVCRIAEERRISSTRKKVYQLTGFVIIDGEVIPYLVLTEEQRRSIGEHLKIISEALEGESKSLLDGILNSHEVNVYLMGAKVSKDDSPEGNPEDKDSFSFLGDSETQKQKKESTNGVSQQTTNAGARAETPQKPDPEPDKPANPPKSPIFHAIAAHLFRFAPNCPIPEQEAVDAAENAVRDWFGAMEGENYTIDQIAEFIQIFGAWYARERPNNTKLKDPQKIVGNLSSWWHVAKRTVASIPPPAPEREVVPEAAPSTNHDNNGALAVFKQFTAEQEAIKAEKIAWEQAEEKRLTEFSEDLRKHWRLSKYDVELLLGRVDAIAYLERWRLLGASDNKLIIEVGSEAARKYLAEGRPSRHVKNIFGRRGYDDHELEFVVAEKIES